MFAHGRLKLQTRDQLQNLTENAAYSVHGGISVRWNWFSTILSNLSRIPPCCFGAQSLSLGGSNLIGTRVRENTKLMGNVAHKELPSMPISRSFSAERAL